MKLIVGLGNPGEKYQNNRHNVGFMFIDYIRDSRLSTLDFSKKSKMLPVANLKSTVYHLRSDIVLAKPILFMNLSGQAVIELIRNWKLEIGNLVVIHDDLDIPLGKFKIQKGTGPLLHNGIESIEHSLGTKDFWRVRIGVDSRTNDTWVDGETYVLRDFPANELTTIKSIFPHVFQRLKKEVLDLH